MLELGDSKNRRAPRTANPKSGRRHAREGRAVLDRPVVQGWRTTDEDEIALPADIRGLNPARRWVASFLQPDGDLPPDADAIEALISAWRTAPAGIRRCVRISRHFSPWVDRARRQSSREQARASFLAEVKAGAASFDLLHYPLLILHLLGQKQALADGVLDGRGDLSALKMPSGRAAFIERMQAMMEAAEKAA